MEIEGGLCKMEVINGSISCSKGLNKDVINKIIEIGKKEGFQLDSKGEIIIKLSAEQIPPEVWISLKLLGLWAAYKVLDEFYDAIKRLIKKTKKDAGILPLIIINQGDNNEIIINPYVEDEKNLDGSLNKLKDYLNQDGEKKGWQWYNEEKKEWGDINKVEEWHKQSSK